MLRAQWQFEPQAVLGTMQNSNAVALAGQVLPGKHDPAWQT